METLLRYAACFIAGVAIGMLVMDPDVPEVETPLPEWRIETFEGDDSLFVEPQHWKEV